jgi:GGDEF domain-containing protein
VAQDFQSEDDPHQDLHVAIDSYLTMLQAVAECLGTACPPVGGLYRQRLNRLRTRLAFGANAKALEESCLLTEGELKDYAIRAASYLQCHRRELRRGLVGLEEIVRTLTLRQDYYGSRLRQLAVQLQNDAAAEDPQRTAEILSLQAAGLLTCVESMSHESQSLLARMQEEMLQVEQRLADAELTDPVTGLMNRREMERRIQAFASERGEPTLLLFDLAEEVPGEIAQQVGARLSAQFRHNDLVARWTSQQFLVLFQGPPETARARSEQVVPWVAGRYLLDDGSTQEIRVSARLVLMDLLLTDTVALRS